MAIDFPICRSLVILHQQLINPGGIILMEYIKRNCGWKGSLNWAVLGAALLSGNSAFAAFTDDIAAGVDNTSFTYSAYVDGANAPFLVASEGVAGGDAVRTGQITQSTATTSAETGFYFTLVGPGTMAFQWSVSSQPFDISTGKGTLLQYSLTGPGPRVSEFITGTVGFQPVEITVPAGSNQFFVSYTRSAGSFAVGQDAGWLDQMVWTPSGSSDTTPDAFSFTGQSDAPLSTMVQSNSITISGINAAADISISSCSSSCEYSINGGGWASASAAAAVSSRDSIRVRQTSSASYAATTTLTLDVGGVTAPFNVTTESAPEPVVVGDTPTGTGTASAFVEAAGNSAPACNVSEAAFVNAPVPPPEGVTLPHGMFGFTSTGCTSGFSVNVTVEYPSAIPADASYWKYDEILGWYTIPVTIVGNTVSFAVTDNETGDSNAAAGTITDPGGIGLGASILPPLGIPTISRWGLIVLAAALAALAAFRMRRRMA